MKVLGYRRSDFAAKDGTAVTGYNVYVGTEIDVQRGEGMAVERIYLSDGKLGQNGISINKLLGQDVKVYYNRYGKPDSIVVAK